MDEPSGPTPANFGALSYDTALAIIPPHSLWEPIDRLRSLHDKAYPKWPPHVNLVYPFVSPSELPRVCEALSNNVLLPHGPVRVSLDAVDSFSQRQCNTVHLKASDRTLGGCSLAQARAACLKVLGDAYDGKGGRLHMTVGQTEDENDSPHKFFMDKARLITPAEWDEEKLAVLVREKLPKHQHGDGSRMRLWGYVNVVDKTVERLSEPSLFYPTPVHESTDDTSIETVPQLSYFFDTVSSTWQRLDPSLGFGSVQSPDRLIVTSYNVLAEFEYPPSEARYPAVLSTILSARARADILVLQEVTDHFLPFLLGHHEIQSRYPYSTHGHPSQPGVGPTPSLLNVAILSKYPFTWQYLPFQRKHKVSAVATFPALRFSDSSTTTTARPLVLGAVHLSQGLTDGAVAAKYNELRKVLRHLSTSYPGYAAVIAGDFNVTTSSKTIEIARKAQNISSQGISNLSGVERAIAEAGFLDTWLTTRLGSGESSAMDVHGSAVELYEGEQGATFDPLNNRRAAAQVAVPTNGRPQRYDRILVNEESGLRPKGFNLFGQGEEASDHWGVRCLLVPDDHSAAEQGVEVRYEEAPASLGDSEELKKCLSSRNFLLSKDDDEARQAALATLERVLRSQDQNLELILIPVGSYGLGVCTAQSDLDVTCVGTISSGVFFSLAMKRIRKAAVEDVSVLRRVRANSGIMLELLVQGFKVDLQYCAARSIVQGWPDIARHPSSDPAFSLPLQTLAKLKPARDLFYLKRSIPDLSQYRIAHLLVKAWATSRGLYSAKFGFLGGIHISILLVPICKALAAGANRSTVSDILTSFFRHYADFDWKSRIVYDPFFHQDLKYHRAFREALCLLGWHAPSLNAANNASAPTVSTLSAELQRARDLLAREGITWETFLGSSHKENEAHQQEATEFLHTYKSYIKIDAHYWGSSPSEGGKFLGWLESRCVSVLVDLDRRVPSLMARIWPARFADAADKNVSDHGQDKPEFHGCYLIGLEWTSTDQSRDSMKLAASSLRMVLNDFEKRLRSDEKYYDENTSHLTAAVVHNKEVSSLRLESGYWSDDKIAVGFDDCDSDSDEFDDEEEEEDDDDNSDGVKEPLYQRSTAVATPIPLPGRFRPASDVLSRLRWDPSMDPSGWIIGYEDRFVGAIEKALDSWKTDQTHEEFIPQHRILYFKRKSDGKVMWERKTRIDRIFGSGVTEVEETKE